MTPAELVSLFRLAVDDTDANDPLWSVAEVDSYLDEAQKQFARKTDYFSDASTVAIVNAAITAGDPWVTLSPRITKLRSAQLSVNNSKVTPVTFAQMEEQPNTADTYGTPYDFRNGYQWQSATGVPRFIVTDMERSKGRLAGIPVISETLVMSVYRLPLVDITSTTAAFEIVEAEYQRGLLFYMKFLAYSKNDVDTFQQGLADRALAEAEAFHLSVKRDTTRRLFSSHNGTVRYGGF